mmetsp:Transcript_45400/g.105332  ORF Transcript_45400/g.105332 Transcript_45400/m.105332 type:complete len:451 (-) Transcript_45400:47-1399(-)
MDGRRDDGANLVARVQAFAKDATTSGTNLDAAIRNLAVAQCEAAQQVEQLRQRLQAYEASSGHVRDLSRGLEVEKAAQEARRVALTDRIGALEGSSSSIQSRHAQMFEAHEVVHADVLAQLRAHNDRHGKVMERFGSVESACNDALQQVRAANRNSEERHASHANNHASLEQRVQYLERVLGDSVSSHQKEMQQSRQSVQELAGHLVAMKSAHDHHRTHLEELRASMSQHQGNLSSRSSSIEDRLRALEAQAVTSGKNDRLQDLEQRVFDVVAKLDRKVQEISSDMVNAQQAASDSTRRLDQHIKELAAARQQLEKARSPGRMDWQPTPQAAGPPVASKRSLDFPHHRSEPTIPTVQQAGTGATGDKDFFRNVSALIVQSERTELQDQAVSCQWGEPLHARTRLTAGTGSAPVGGPHHLLQYPQGGLRPGDAPSRLKAPQPFKGSFGRTN